MGDRRLQFLRRVFFSWEEEPGRSKENPDMEKDEEEKHEKAREEKDIIKLPPPPRLTESPRISGHDLYIPLPPLPFRSTPLRSFSRRRSRRENDDPFLAAYMECSRSFVQETTTVPMKKKGSAFGLARHWLRFTCKDVACGVNEDAVHSSFFPS